MTIRRGPSAAFAVAVHTPLTTLLFIVVGLGAMAVPRRAGASGERHLSTFFDFATHPDFPLEEFAAGRLGVLQPGFRVEYLAVAWRYLHGGRLDAAERAAAAEVFRARLRLPAEPGSRSRALEGRVAAWSKARSAVKGARPSSEIRLYKESSQWVEYSTCLADAFDTASRTLRDRVARLGADSPEVKAWLEAQDQVFENCGSAEPGGPGANDPAGVEAGAEPREPRRASVPAPLPDGASAAARADRDYQIAAALFYQSRFEEAAQRFHRIAADAASPWAPLGNYLAARALIRKATLAKELDRVALSDAERELQAITSGAEGGEARARAERLLNLVAYQLHPEEQARTLARRIDRGSRDLRNDLTDYVWLVTRMRWDGGERARPLVDPARLRADDELSDWALAFEGIEGLWVDEINEPQRRQEALTHALAKFRASRSLPWLVAALMLVPATHPEAAALIEAASRVPDASPAHDTLAWHSLRLLIESGREDRITVARRRLDALLPVLRASRPGATLNRFLALRLRIATSLDDVVDFGQRWALGSGTEDDDFEVPDDLAMPGRKRAPPQLRLDDDAAELIATRLPLALLVRLLDHPRLAEALKPELLRALFVRAITLDDMATARQLLPAAQALVVDAPAWKEGLAAFAAATTDDDRRFAALLMVLRMPGLRPWVDAGLGRQTPVGKQDEFRDNWWCNPKDGHVSASRASATGKPVLPSMAWLTDAERKAAEAELAKLVKAGAGANLLAARTIDYARAHPDDARLPEALYLVNRATHYGCKDDRTSSWSKQAYLVLHKGWPKSEWAKKVRYWW